jgi:hypothetical protein
MAANKESLAFLDWLTPQISTIQLKQVERTKNCTGERAMAAD